MTFPVLHPRYPSLISQCLSTQQGPLIATATVQHAIKPHLSLPWSSMSPYHPTSHHQPNLPPALPSSKPTTVFSLLFSSRDASVWWPAASTTQPPKTAAALSRACPLLSDEPHRSLSFANIDQANTGPGSRASCCQYAHILVHCQLSSESILTSLVTPLF